MEVHGHAEHSYYLLREGADWYLDVNCNQSAAGFSILIHLTEAESIELHALGPVFLAYLAAKVNYWSTDYWKRNAPAEVRTRADAAISRWRPSA